MGYPLVLHINHLFISHLFLVFIRSAPGLCRKLSQKESSYCESLIVTPGFPKVAHEKYRLPDFYQIRQDTQIR